MSLATPYYWVENLVKLFLYFYGASSYLKTTQNTNLELSFGRYQIDWINIQKYYAWSPPISLMRR